MTAISALVTASPPSAADDHAPQVGASSVGRSFAELLNNGERHERRQQPRAYSFAELGMFGVHAAQGNQVSHHPNVLYRPEDLTETDDTIGAEPQLWAAIPQGVASFAENPVAQIDRASPSVQSISADRAPAKLAQANTLASTGKASGSGRSEPDFLPSLEPGRPAAAKVLTKPESPVAQPMSVVIAGEKHALKIAVRTNGAPAHLIPKLRRLVETTVTQFEMDIAELHFNGTAGSPAFSLGGGLYGGRAH
jgi:hypothetical protein